MIAMASNRKPDNVIEKKKDDINVNLGGNSNVPSELPTPKRKEVSSTPNDLFAIEIVPSHDTIFRKVYNEFERLRGCSCSRRDLIKFIDVRDQKAIASKIISFW